MMRTPRRMSPRCRASIPSFSSRSSRRLRACTCSPRRRRPATPPCPITTASRSPRGTTDARPFLDRLPFGVLVYRLSHLLYANQPFLRWSGYENVGALAEAGGLDSLFVEPGAVSFETGGDKPFAISSSVGEETKAEGRAVPGAVERRVGVCTVDRSGCPTPCPSRRCRSSLRGSQTLTLGRLKLGSGRRKERAAQDRAAEQREQAARAALAAAQAESAELNAILDTATDGVVVVDRAGRSCRPTAAPRRCSATRPASSPAAASFDLFAPESRDAALDYLDGLAAGRRRERAQRRPRGDRPRAARAG